MKETKDSAVFSQVICKHDNPVASFDCVDVLQSIVYVSEKYPLINKLFRSKTQKNVHFIHPNKTPMIL